MPRYFINTFGGFEAHDDHGLALPNVETLATVMREVLADMLRNVGENEAWNELRAEAWDEAGHRVMTATISMSIQMEPQGRV